MTFIDDSSRDFSTVNEGFVEIISKRDLILLSGNGLGESGDLC